MSRAPLSPMAQALREERLAREEERLDYMRKGYRKIGKFMLVALAFALIFAFWPESEDTKQIRDGLTWDQYWADVPGGPTRSEYVAMKAAERNNQNVARVE